MSSRESLIEFPRILAREASGIKESWVALPIVVDQPDHTSGFSDPSGCWCSKCAIPAGGLPGCFVGLCIPADPGMARHPPKFDVRPLLLKCVDRL